MEGLLRKTVSKVKLFQKNSFPKRYVIIDFTSANIFVKYEKESIADPTFVSTQECKIIPFRSIKECSLPTDSSFPSKRLPKNWQMAFHVKTIERDFTFMTQTESERKMWMAGFRYVIASTLTVQVIMKHNSRQQQEKLKERTE